MCKEQLSRSSLGSIRENGSVCWSQNRHSLLVEPHCFFKRVFANYYQSLDICVVRTRVNHKLKFSVKRVALRIVIVTIIYHSRVEEIMPSKRKRNSLPDGRLEDSDTSNSVSMVKKRKKSAQYDPVCKVVLNFDTWHVSNMTNFISKTERKIKKKVICEFVYLYLYYNKNIVFTAHMKS